MSEYIKRPPKKAARKRVYTRDRSTVQPDEPGYHTAAMAQPRIGLSARRQESLVAEAIEYVRETVEVGVIYAAIDQASGYAGDRIWSALTSDWLGRNCRGLARLARLTLQGKDWVHTKIGHLAGQLLTWLGTPRVVRAFGRQLAKRIPMPWDHQFVVVARGMQIAGIVVCFMNDRDLMQCECFIDVVISEGKERVAELMRKAAENWQHLDQLLPIESEMGY